MNSLADRKIVAISGSVRKGSFNAALLRLGVDFLSKAGAEVSTINLGSLNLPIYNGDVEASGGLPMAALKLRETIANAGGIFVCSPEYNGSVTPILKNAIDWVSRPHNNEAAGKVFLGKVVCLAGASQGDKAALRGLAHLASIFMNLGTVLVPQSYGLRFAAKTFDIEKGFLDQKEQSAFTRHLETFGQLLAKI